MANVRPSNHFRRLAPLIAVCIGAAVVGFQQPAQSGAATPAASSPPDAPNAAAPPSWALPVLGHAELGALPADSAPDARIAGKVLEQIDVEKYSYLRLGGAVGSETWTAVPLTAPSVGQTVVISNVEQMTQFTSASLKRTFDVIYFGVLEPADGQADAVAMPESTGLAALALSDPHGSEMAPHPGPGKDADAVSIAKSEKAIGPLGRTIGELNALEHTASGTKVRVRATVVKVTTGVLGRTFLHLRDGTGAAPLSNDLTATSNEDFDVAREVLLEGTIEVDKDFGSGYRYRVLLSDARRVAP